MEEKKIKTDEEMIVCPSCAGTGKEGVGLDCSACGGIGLGHFYKDHFFYWRPQIGFAVIELDHFRKQANLLINLIAFGIGFIGLACLFVWFYNVSSHSVRIEDFAFWQQAHWLLAIFWLSTFADFFIIYRFARDLMEQGRVKIFRFGQKESQGTSISQLSNWEELRQADSRSVVDVSKAYSPEAYSAIEEAYLFARRLRHGTLLPIHVFFTLLGTREASAIFTRLNADFEKLFDRLKAHIGEIEPSDQSTALSSLCKEAFVEAYIDSSEWDQKKVTPKNLIFRMIAKEPLLAEILSDMEIDQSMIANVIAWFSINERQVSAYQHFRSLARFKPSNNMDRAYTSVATPVLNSFAYDLTVAAKWSKLDFCVDREKETQELWDILSSGANSVLFYGPDGVGKNTFVSGLAQRMVEENVPKFLLDKRLIELDVARLVSGVTASQAEGRLMMILDEVNKAGNIALYINGLEKMVGITDGSEGSMDLAEVLNSAIGRRMLYVFASTTSENYLRHIEGRSLDANMAKIEIREPKGDQAIQIIESKIAGLEKRFGVYYSYSAIEKAVILSDKYMHDSYLPAKAIQILEKAGARSAKNDKDLPIIDGEQVARIISEITEIPITKVTATEGKELLNLEERMHERMVGQHEAIKMVASSLCRARTQLREGVRPIASFLFLGPTGVGKTELAKTVAHTYFGDEKYMLRIDMSEYQHKDSIVKLIGDSDGTKGHLTELVRKSPFSLILLDEIEKAHPDILNLFLQVMDDGRLTDGQGRLIDFTNNVIIATSNVGADYIQEEIFKGTGIDKISTELINNHLNKVMRPELINRFDGIVVFEPLSLGNVVEIARLMLKKVGKLLAGKGMEMKIEDEGLRSLAKLGFDPKFGARPLRRVIQDKIEDQIANKILAGELKRRDTVVISGEASVSIEKGAPV